MGHALVHPADHDRQRHVGVEGEKKKGRKQECEGDRYTRGYDCNDTHNEKQEEIEADKAG